MASYNLADWIAEHTDCDVPLANKHYYPRHYSLTYSTHEEFRAACLKFCRFVDNQHVADCAEEAPEIGWDFEDWRRYHQSATEEEFERLQLTVKATEPASARALLVVAMSALRLLEVTAVVLLVCWVTVPVVGTARVCMFTLLA